ncbi:hypothetical protein [Methylocystis echinoides]|uniref:hypothetical protein n=1 Tax=Methylocystis echinoides TaxID=29468 RepID=UPI00344912B3
MAESGSTPNRRTLLTGLAAAPVVGLPAVASAYMASDPIFSAIAGRGRLNAELETAMDHTDNTIVSRADKVSIDAAWRAQHVAGDALDDADAAIFGMQPQTPQGALALLRHVATVMGGDPGQLYHEGKECEAIMRCVAFLEATGGQQ